jgi:predicted O-linked N-acetylglucosamine transferase (SPINDLY family)
MPAVHLWFSLYKYDPDTFTTWCNILKRVPDRYVVVLYSNSSHLSQQVGPSQQEV